MYISNKKVHSIVGGLGNTVLIMQVLAVLVVVVGIIVYLCIPTPNNRALGKNKRKFQLFQPYFHISTIFPYMVQLGSGLKSKTKALDQRRTLNSLWIHPPTTHPPPTENFSKGFRLPMGPRFGM